MLELGLTDGLPVIPPTPERVDALLEGCNRDPDDVIGVIPPRKGRLTVRLCAVNAVMAGCSENHLGLVIRAIEAMLEPPFNLHGLQTTTHPVGPCIIVSGPIADQVGVHSGSGCVGPGFHANSAIGRAVHLILRNVGGAVPGTTDAATLGTPSKRGLCFADIREGNPWPTLAEEWTGDASKSVVTVVPTEGPHNVNDHYGATGAGILTMVARSLATIGANDPYYPDSTPVVVLGPEHARTVAADGFSREDAKRFIAEHARIELRNWSHDNQEGRFRKKRPLLYGEADEHTTIPVVSSPDHLVLLVAGGVGKHSLVIPTVGVGVRVTVTV
jgi:hypothetical protein